MAAQEDAALKIKSWLRQNSEASHSLSAPSNARVDLTEKNVSLHNNNAPETKNDGVIAVDCYVDSIIDDEVMDTEYRSPEPAVVVVSDMPSDRQKLHELHTIFVVNGISIRGQNALLRWMRELTADLVERIPVDCRTLRPPPIPHTVRVVPPGKVVYFGIQNILNIPGIDLFHTSENEIRLTVNIDGLPLFRQTNGMGFWPILGSIDQYPVFLIGLYEGKQKPICANDFLHDFIEEAKELRMKGVVLRDVVYRFVVEKMIMDAPAMAYVTGIKGHSGYSCCSKCRVCGEQVTLPTGRKGVRLLDTDAALRCNLDFQLHYDYTSDPHTNDDDLDCVDVDEEEQGGLLEASLGPDIDSHHKHPTALVTIPGFNIIRDVPLDYMHMVLVGVVKRLLVMWTTSSLYKMKKLQREIVSDRLISFRDHFPCEFQRKSESLEFLSAWKATQFRSFLLYTGIIALNGILDKKYFNHFSLLCICMRIVTCRVDRSANRSSTLQQRGMSVKQWLRKFVTDGIELYTPAFAVYNVHNIIHLADDYMRFGPVDQYSAFRYESFLGCLKRLVTGNFHPVAQVINKYSSLLLTQQFGKEGNRAVDYVEEYWEVPELLYPLNEDDEIEDYSEVGHPSCANKNFECYEMMRFKNFVLRTGKEADSYCVVGGLYMKLIKILQDKTTKQIYITGRFFQQIENLFTEPQLPCSSKSVGIAICSGLSLQSYMKHIGKISEKCFALPYQSPTNDDETVSRWVLIRYTH